MGIVKSIAIPPLEGFDPVVNVLGEIDGSLRRISREAAREEHPAHHGEDLARALAVLWDIADIYYEERKRREQVAGER